MSDAAPFLVDCIDTFSLDFTGRSLMVKDVAFVKIRAETMNRNSTSISLKAIVDVVSAALFCTVLHVVSTIHM